MELNYPISDNVRNIEEKGNIESFWANNEQIVSK